jgi:hypothetical protein
MTENIKVAKMWMNEPLRRLFRAEIANEGPTDDYGATPATVFSSIDSLLQAPSIFFPNDSDLASAALALLGIIVYGECIDTEVGDLL